MGIRSYVRPSTFYTGMVSDIMEVVERERCAALGIPYPIPKIHVTCTQRFQRPVRWRKVGAQLIRAFLYPIFWPKHWPAPWDEEYDDWLELLDTFEESATVSFEVPFREIGDDRLPGPGLARTRAYLPTLPPHRPT